MSILAWIEDQREGRFLEVPKYNHKDSTPNTRSQGLWTRCDNCGVILYIKHLKENKGVCFGCGYHLQMESRERIWSLIDSGTWRPLDETLSPLDPLDFKDQKPYIERLRDAQKKTKLQDAIQTGTGLLDGIPIALGVMDFNFMGGSMGSVVGEKITRLIEYATGEGYTLVLVCASGGARMQEGIYSLMQMAKISSALQVYQSCANLLYISVITSPTTGGVTASFAMLGDLVFAEPKALIGFAGRRVIEQTLQENLPDDFQTAEYLLHHGLLDLIVPRCFLKAALSEIIYLYKNAPKKRLGTIPYGITNPLSFLEVESILRSLRQKPISKYDSEGFNQTKNSNLTFDNDTREAKIQKIEKNDVSNVSTSEKLKITNNTHGKQLGSSNISFPLDSVNFSKQQEGFSSGSSLKDFQQTSKNDRNLQSNFLNLSVYSKSRASFKSLKELFNLKSNYLNAVDSSEVFNDQITSFSQKQKGANVGLSVLEHKEQLKGKFNWLSTIELATLQKIRWINKKIKKL